MSLEALQGSQGSQVRLLPLTLSRITGTWVEPCGEVADPVDCVPREESFGQLSQVEPPEWSVLQGAIVQVEPIYVEVGNQSLFT